MIRTQMIQIRTKGYSDIVNLTPSIQQVLDDNPCSEGLVQIFAVGSTASITTMEFEPALVQDLKDILEALIPSDAISRHSQTWGDDNGFSHLRATLMGPALTVPIIDGKMALGTWQQVVLIDHDNRERERVIIVQIMGEQG